jgi:hypothetical protein
MTNMPNLHQSTRNSTRAPGTVPARFVVGRDEHGGWIVQDRQGLVGGLFANEAAAMHFASEECNHNPADVCRAADDVVLEFDCLGAATANMH